MDWAYSVIYTYICEMDGKILWKRGHIEYLGADMRILLKRMWNILCGIKLIWLVQDKIRWLAVVSKEMNLVPIKLDVIFG